MPSERSAVYAGTFDPLTLGHLDIIGRAAALFDRLIVAVAASEGKQPVLSLDNRLKVARAAVTDVPGCPIDVRPLNGLLVTFASEHGAGIIVRGLREAADFDYEIQMASMNRRLAPRIDTVFLMAGEPTRAISGTLVRQIVHAGGDISPFVPAAALAVLTGGNRRG